MEEKCVGKVEKVGEGGKWRKKTTKGEVSNSGGHCSVVASFFFLSFFYFTPFFFSSLFV